MTTFTGPFGVLGAVVNDGRALRRDEVVWSGTGGSSPSIWITARPIPAVCRHGRPIARRRIPAASMAMSEQDVGRPRCPVLAGAQARRASGVTHTVRPPRCRRPWSHSRQLETSYAAFGIS
jgi:hypothetical protein